MAALQAAIIGVCIDSSKEAWKLEWNLQLITIIYLVRSFLKLCLSSIQIEASIYQVN
jgi:hypothetical protein